ncbi:MAG: Spy/CpxP family protein refolding chaperone [Acidobacteriia bacterium]|nr:Spy/CpxP family protein refolding chaperone [Terriglobia bacterium]
MRTTLLKVTTAVLALASVFAMAQHGNPPDPGKMAQRHLDFLTKQLSLTPQQQQQANTIFSDAASNAKANHDQMRSAHDSLKAAIQKNDSAGIEQAANTIGNLTTQMITAHAKAQAAFYQTLTPDQQAKMNDLESHRGMGMRRHGWGHGGHGGPGDPPPGASF